MSKALSVVRERVLRIASQRVGKGYKYGAGPSKFDNIVIAMSSGVDSSLAASLYSNYPKARGIFMENWSQSLSMEDPSKEKCYEKDWKDVLKVGKHVNLPVERINFEHDYWIDVFEPMLEQYRAGTTPNPDVGCNKFIKFGSLRKHLDSLYGTGNYWLVTGHYAQVLQDAVTQETHLLRAFYKQKDQSYYLSQIPHCILPQLLLPLGGLTKPEVREMARDLQLPTALKSDSQGICFVANSQHGRFQKFLQEYLPAETGDVVTIDTTSGEKRTWGKHKGLWSYTIGQKIGIAMPQGDPQFKGQWFVSEKRMNTNEIVIVRGHANPALYQNTLRVRQFEALGGNEIMQRLTSGSVSGLNLQYRSLQEPVAATACEWNGKDLIISLPETQRAMAPGQYCCVYDGDRVLGSGTIEEAYSRDTDYPIRKQN
ncbi:LAMI_0H19416g1_1 [Lachancea mirantina]|uniref:tRNA-5-taurinomethyluridine 2-sulfurtransferase n=1 Tax=Lachancea mirantina TaxID=1230905 RepID=A0A1G4KJX0_9SACH|nr:LAMI_0H19416g1_1 [Lachancea mirantina]